MLARAIEYDVLPTCLRHGMGVLTYSPLAMGWLSGRYRIDAEAPASGRFLAGCGSPRGSTSALESQPSANSRPPTRSTKLAEDAGMTLIELAIAFVIRHPAVTSAIIGPRTMEHLKSQLPAAEITLSDEVLDRIDEIVPPGADGQRRRQHVGHEHDGPGRRVPPPSGRRNPVRITAR